MTQETKWSFDPAHSEIAFKIKHLMISNIKGQFKSFDGDISASDDFSTAEVDVWIDPSSISTGDIKRDEHLKSVEFFDVTNHKQITFSDASIEKSIKTGDLELWGNLTMKGITKRIKLNVEYGGKMIDPMGNEKAGFSITGTINRKDWHLNWNTLLEAGGILVDEDVSINCEIQLARSTNQEMSLKSSTKKEANIISK